MKYIDDGDLPYLLSKYHDANAPFNPFDRFRCWDGSFDMSTGLGSAAMEAGLREYLSTLEDTSHAMLKAKAFGYVTEHTPIMVSPHDYFVGIHSLDRVISRVLTSKWWGEVFGGKLAGTKKRLDKLNSDGALTTWPDYDHSVPNYDYILPLGFPGMLRQVERSEYEFGELDDDQRAFYESARLELEGILRLLDRFIGYASAHPSEKSPAVLRALTHLINGAPTDTYEALLFIYIYFMCSEHIEGLQVRSLSNLDRTLYPYYKADLDGGRCTEEELRRFIAYFYIQFSALGNYWGQPVYFGGTKRDGSSMINELSYILLDVYDQMGIYNPKLQIKYSAVTPRPYLEKALGMIRRGHSSIVFVCEETMTAAMLKNGFTPEEARTANVTGCYEYAPLESIGSLGMYFNLAKMVEYTLFGGRDPKTGVSIGYGGCAESYDSFGELLDAYLGCSKYAIGETVSAVNEYEPYYEYLNPMPLFSASRISSLEKAKDAYCSGSESYMTLAELGCLADAADSLAMIKKYVYDRREITLDELKKALLANFEGYDELRLKLKRDRDKYGNNRELPDSIAVRISSELADFINGRQAGRPNGKWYAGFHVARMYINWKDVTGALPSGRKRGEELAKNASPEQGMAVNGATALTLSLTKLDGSKFMSDFPLDVFLHPSSVMGEEGMTAMLGVLGAYRAGGGHAVHFNVLDTETLRKAQENPDAYRDLQIRVCGWNALFTSMNRFEQDAFIRASEASK